MASRTSTDALLDAYAADHDLLATIRDQAADELKQHATNAFAEYLTIVIPDQRPPDATR